MPSIFERITAFNKNRIPDIVELKYKAMSQNAFSFFRGTCHLFYEDLSAAKALPSSPLTWLCGDLHLENFGSYKGDNHLVYFDLNDFDEGVLAPAAWELARIVTSILVGFDSLGFDAGMAKKTAGMYLDIYADTIKTGKAISIDPRIAEGIVCTFLTTAEKRKQKQLVKRVTTSKKGKLELLLDDKHFKIEKPLKKELQQFVNDWVKTGKYAGYDFNVLDSVFRVAGTGSLGVKRYLFLLKSQNTKDKYLFIDMKQATASSLQPYLKTDQPKWRSEAERVIAIQQRMQNVSPALLGAAIFDNESFVLKQMQPTADKINFEVLKNQNGDIDEIITDMAKLTASAQVRSGGRQGSGIIDALIEFGDNNSKWQDDVLKYASSYAQQVKKDYQEFMEGYNNNRYQEKD